MISLVSSQVALERGDTWQEGAQRRGNKLWDKMKPPGPIADVMETGNSAKLNRPKSAGVPVAKAGGPGNLGSLGRPHQASSLLRLWLQGGSPLPKAFHGTGQSACREDQVRVTLVLAWLGSSLWAGEAS